MKDEQFAHDGRYRLRRAARNIGSPTPAASKPPALLGPAKDGRRFRNAEFFAFEGELIRRIEGYFGLPIKTAPFCAKTIPELPTLYFHAKNSVKATIPTIPGEE